MEEDKIVLDRKSFEALAVDSRVKLLKSLKQRRKTLSELANEQKMSVSGVKEHLETLENVGLVEKKDDGHKWKYYELTRKGKDVVGPKEIRVWILLVTSVIALFSSLILLQTSPGIGSAGQVRGGEFFSTISDTKAIGSENQLIEDCILAESDEIQIEQTSEDGSEGLLFTSTPIEESDLNDTNDSRDCGNETPGDEMGKSYLIALPENSEEGMEEPNSQTVLVNPLILEAIIVISIVTLFGCVAILIKNRISPRPN